MTKLLLVEDDQSLREIYGVRLQAEGYDIVSAGDGEEPLALAIKERPDLIVSDVMMPKISGFDMLDILRSTSETKNIKVIMMTALSSEDQRARGESLGADRYLVKSQVGIEDAVRTVHDVLGDGPAPAAGSSVPTFPPATATPVASAPAPVPVPAAPTPAPVPIAPPMVNMPAPAPAPAPVPAPAPIPVPASVPVPPPAPDVTLPAPTAPFSTPRPASLGNTVIEPLASAQNITAPTNDIAAQVNQVLGSVPEPAPQLPPQQQQPPLPPAPTI
jgi:CheY-like chemotaxis protein